MNRKKIKTRQWSQRCPIKRFETEIRGTGETERERENTHTHTHTAKERARNNVKIKPYRKIEKRERKGREQEINNIEQWRYQIEKRKYTTQSRTLRRLKKERNTCSDVHGHVLRRGRRNRSKYSTTKYNKRIFQEGRGDGKLTDRKKKKLVREGSQQDKKKW